MDLEETVARNDCAGEGQQQCNRPTNRSVSKEENLIFLNTGDLFTKRKGKATKTLFLK
jgi:hypothetical protein